MSLLSYGRRKINSMTEYFTKFVWLFYYLMVINIVTFFIFGIDKYLAVIKWRRIAEKVLWILSVIGGSLGGFIGMEIFRHKRRKMNFYLVMLLILLAHIACIYLIVLRCVE